METMETQDLGTLNNLPLELFNLVIFFTCNRYQTFLNRNGNKMTIRIHEIENGLKTLEKLLGIRNRELQRMCRNNIIAETVFGKALWKKGFNDRTLKCAKYGVCRVFDYCLDSEFSKKSFRNRQNEMAIMRRVQKQGSIVKAAIGHRHVPFLNYLITKYQVRVPLEYYFSCLTNKGNIWNNAASAIVCYQHNARITLNDTLYIERFPLLIKYLKLWFPNMNVNDDVSHLIASYTGHQNFLQHFIQHGLFQMTKSCLDLAIMGDNYAVWSEMLRKGQVQLEPDTILRLFAVQNEKNPFELRADLYEDLLRRCASLLTREQVFVLYEHHCIHNEMELGITLIMTFSGFPYVTTLPHLSLAHESSMAIAIDNGALWAAQFLRTNYKIQAPSGYMMQHLFDQAWQQNSLSGSMLHTFIRVGALDNTENPTLAERMVEWLHSGETIAIYYCLERPTSKNILFNVAKNMPNSDETFIYLVNLALSCNYHYYRQDQ